MLRRSVLVLVAATALSGCGSDAPKRSAADVVQVSVSACGQGWSGGRAGAQHLLVTNTDSRPGGVDLVAASTGAVYAEVEPLAPGTSDTMSADLGAGRYALRCLMEDEPAVTGPAVTLTGKHRGLTPAVAPVTQGDLVPATKAYEGYVTGRLPHLRELAGQLDADVAAGRLAAARTDWLAAHLAYLGLGAAYSAFGDLDAAIDARADGLPLGVHDPSWTGLHRIEYGLWHGEPMAKLRPVTRELVRAVDALRQQFAHAQLDPAEIAIRAHEITEDAVEFALTGREDYGSHSALATVRADVDATRAVLDLVRPLLAPRFPGLPGVDAQLRRTAADLDALHGDGRWPAPATLSVAVRERIDADASELAERLAPVAAVLEPREDVVSVERRRFLQSAAAALGTAAVAGAGVERASGPTATASPTVPFEGAHQAGIVTDRQQNAAFVSFDVEAGSRDEFAAVLQTLTDRIRRLTAGGVTPSPGISAPPPDSGILGPAAPADRLTVTVGLGASAFVDERFGLGEKRPRRLRPMDVFPDDDLDRERCDGDLMLQICADGADTVLHALRDITRHTRGGLQVRWRINGFLAAPRPTGTPRNLMGFKDGIANPDVTDPATADRLLWVRAGSGEPAWATGGSYQVVRVIRMLTEFWDRVTLGEQERMIGRRRDSGAPLSGSRETDVPDYRDDPTGSAVRLDAHIRLANPRTAATADRTFLRRGYNYDLGVDANGNLDMGLIFAAYQQDLDRQFVAAQKRLAGEPLVDYVVPVAGGYFFALPGVRDRRDWLGRELFA